MQRHFLTTLIALIMLIPGFAQQVQEKRRSHSQYAFTTFKEAKIHQSFGRYTNGKVNFRLWDGALCFVDEDKKIRRAYVNNILSVDVDDEKYLKIDTIFGRVVASKGNNHVVCVTLIDKDTYGKEITNRNNKVQLNYFLEDIELEEEETYPLKDYIYLVIKGEVIPARESTVKKHIAPELKKSFISHTRDPFWSWRDPYCVGQLLMFFD